jgi:hypothetical protein
MTFMQVERLRALRHMQIQPAVKRECLSQSVVLLQNGETDAQTIHSALPCLHALQVYPLRCSLQRALARWSPTSTGREMKLPW